MINCIANPKATLFQGNGKVEKDWENICWVMKITIKRLQIRKPKFIQLLLVSFVRYIFLSFLIPRIKKTTPIKKRERKYKNTSPERLSKNILEQ